MSKLGTRHLAAPSREELDGLLIQKCKERALGAPVRRKSRKSIGIKATKGSKTRRRYTFTVLRDATARPGLAAEANGKGKATARPGLVAEANIKGKATARPGLVAGGPGPSVQVDMTIISTTINIIT